MVRVARMTDAIVRTGKTCLKNTITTCCKEGILHFKSKEYAMARRYFERALDAADDLQTQAQANYYMSQVVDDPRQKRQFLEETLAIDMGHAAARRALAILDGKLKPAEIVNPDAIPAPIAGTQAGPG